VIAEINARLGTEEKIRHVTRNYLNYHIKIDHAGLKRNLRRLRGFRDLTSAKATLKGIETFRAIRNVEFDGANKGVGSNVAFVANPFQDPA
jgi:transposase, IS6 family